MRTWVYRRLADSQDTQVGDFRSAAPQTCYETLSFHVHQWPNFKTPSIIVECLQLILITPYGKGTLPKILPK